jgi:hypothetical protein
MTPKSKHVSEKLPKLIAAENDLETMKTLTAELQGFLDEEAAERDVSRRYC